MYKRMFKIFRKYKCKFKKIIMRFIILYILDYEVESWIMLSMDEDKGICSVGGRVGWKIN